MSFYRMPFSTLMVGVLIIAGCDSAGDNVEDEPEPALKIRLVGQLSILNENPNAIHSDVWGYVDANTGKEYALIGGLGQGTRVMHIVDVSDPAVPVLTASIDVPGFDMKVWQHYAYTVTGGGDQGTDPDGRIVDLSDPANPVVVGAFPSAHNIFIDDQGFLYLEAPGLRIMDLNPDPTDPLFVWSDGTRDGHDATVIGDRLYDFHGRSGTHIYDVTNRSAPQLLGSITLPSIRYHHGGWTTRDGAYLLLCDELSQDSTADITIWDVRDPSNPVLAAEIGDQAAIVHNLYIIDDLAYVSYYTAGFRVYDVSDPRAPRLVDEFDTATMEQGASFNGAWGVYPFTPSGHIYVSDTANGLYVFALDR